MSMVDILNKIRQLIAEHIPAELEQIQPDTLLFARTHTANSEWNLDSLDLVELVMRVEDEFGVEISDEDAENVQTPRELATLVQRCQRCPRIQHLISADDTEGGATD